MNEEEKKALKVINTRTKRLLDEFKIEKEDMSDEPKIAYLMQEIRANKTILNLIEKLQKENQELKEYIVIAPNLDEMTAIKYRNIRRDAYLQGRVEEQQKAEQIINENYIPIQKVKDKIEEEIKYHEKNILDIENITMLRSKTAKEEAEIEFNKYAIVVLNKILQELIKESEEN